MAGGGGGVCVNAGAFFRGTLGGSDNRGTFLGVPMRRIIPILEYIKGTPIWGKTKGPLKKGTPCFYRKSPHGFQGHFVRVQGGGPSFWLWSLGMLLKCEVGDSSKESWQLHHCSYGLAPTTCCSHSHRLEARGPRCGSETYWPTPCAGPGMDPDGLVSLFK